MKPRAQYAEGEMKFAMAAEGGKRRSGKTCHDREEETGTPTITCETRLIRKL